MRRSMSGGQKVKLMALPSQADPYGSALPGLAVPHNLPQEVEAIFFQ